MLYKTVEVDMENIGGQTLWSYAAQNGHKAVVKLLLEKGARIEAKDNSGRAPLLYAAENGHAVIKLLLEYGADTCSENPDGRTPLLLATLHNYQSIIKLLVERNASVVSVDKYGDTPLRWARINESEAAAILLLEKDTEEDSRHSSRLGMFHLAANNSHEKVLRQQLRNRIDVNCTTNFRSKRLALLQATAHVNETVVKLLLKAGANVNMSDTAGDTLLSQAALSGNSM
jgi:ankyrin repeat protein